MPVTTPRHLPRGHWGLATALLLFAVAGCTDATFYSPGGAPARADRVALEGRVCTEDPVRARFPVRVVLLVDRAAGPLYSEYDPGGKRLDALRAFVRDSLDVPRISFAVVGYAGRAKKLAPQTTAFTRNRAQLRSAIRQLSIPRPCLGENQCRDYRDAIRKAGAIIENDAARTPAGLRVLTQYVVMMVNGGPHKPLVPPQRCCPEDDATCRQKRRNASGEKREKLAHACEATIDAQAVERLGRTVEQTGAAGFRFHAYHLATHRGTKPNSGEAEVLDKRIESAMESMAFAGGGVYERYNSVGGFDAEALDVLDLRTVLRSKLLMAVNTNTLAGPDGREPDSDADGLSDSREDALGVSATKADTDGEGVTDRIELLVGLAPTDPDRPDSCDGERPGGDRDADGLTNCDENLIGTEPTLVDSDGDAMPDRLEIAAGTDYLGRDAENDVDGDGTANSQELKQHTDPRSIDTADHLTRAYRYEIDDRGVIRDLSASSPRSISGVEIAGVGNGTDPGVGRLDFRPSPPRLRWREAGDRRYGSAVRIDGSGRYELPAASHRPRRETGGKHLVVKVTPSELPARRATDSIRVISRSRQCLDYTIRNIQLAATRGREGVEAGRNDIVLYFAEAPEGRLRRPGPFRRAEIPVVFEPPSTRRPASPIIEVDDSEFVRPRLRRRNR
ncbi:MAG: hypothetical protein ABEL76_07785 [Bradymonadaceae bacterium]